MTSISFKNVFYLLAQTNCDVNSRSQGSCGQNIGRFGYSRYPNSSPRRPYPVDEGCRNDVERTDFRHIYCTDSKIVLLSVALGQGHQNLNCSLFCPNDIVKQFW